MGSRLLDIGCGNGAYTLKLAEAFDETVGVDIEPDRLADFRAEVGERAIEVLECSAADLPFADGHFDVVTAIETMEHLGAHLHPVMAEMARVIRPGGDFYLTTPNRLWPLEQHGVVWRGRRRSGTRFPFVTWVPPVHRRLSSDEAFTARRLDSLIERHGFRRVGLTRMWPPLDSRPALARRAARVFDAVDRTPGRLFAQTLVMRYRRV